MRIPSFILVGLLVLTAAVSSCGGSTDSTGTDSNTHWLERCVADGDCGALSCICGTCTTACSDASNCGDFGSTATCTTVSGCTAVPAPSACVVTCSSDADCSGGQCDAGQCRRIAAGSGSGGGSSAGGSSASGGSTSSGGSGGMASGSCAAMDAHDSGLDCAATVGYAWDGTTCRPITCSCAGADCGGIFATANECDTAYSACLAAQGFVRSCTTHADCTLTSRDCCFACGIQEPANMLAVRADSLTVQLNACENSGCPECATSFNPALQSACIDGQCQLIDLTPYAACTSDEDCRLRTKDCCECGGDTTNLISVNASFPSTPDWCADDVACDACLPDYGSFAIPSCAVDQGMCTMAFLL